MRCARFALIFSSSTSVWQPLLFCIVMRLVSGLMLALLARCLSRRADDTRHVLSELTGVVRALKEDRHTSPSPPRPGSGYGYAYGATGQGQPGAWEGRGSGGGAPGSAGLYSRGDAYGGGYSSSPAAGGYTNGYSNGLGGSEVRPPPGGYLGYGGGAGGGAPSGASPAREPYSGTGTAANGAGGVGGSGGSGVGVPGEVSRYAGRSGEAMAPWGPSPPGSASGNGAAAPFPSSASAGASAGGGSATKQAQFPGASPSVPRQDDDGGFGAYAAMGNGGAAAPSAGAGPSPAPAVVAIADAGAGTGSAAGGRGEEPVYPKSFQEVMDMVSRGVTPPNVRVSRCVLGQSLGVWVWVRAAAVSCCVVQCVCSKFAVPCCDDDSGSRSYHLCLCRRTSTTSRLTQRALPLSPASPHAPSPGSAAAPLRMAQPLL